VTTHKPISAVKTELTIETTGFAVDVVAGVVTTAPFGITTTGVPGSGKAAISGFEFVTFAS